MNDTCTILRIVSSYRSSVYAKKRQRQRKSKRVGVNVCQNVFRDELLVYADMKEREKKKKRLSAREKVSFNKSLRKSVLWRVCLLNNIERGKAERVSTYIRW